MILCTHTINILFNSTLTCLSPLHSSFCSGKRSKVRLGLRQPDKHRLSKGHCYLFVLFAVLRTQISNSTPVRPTHNDRPGNTGQVFQDRSSAKAKIQLLERMLKISIWSKDTVQSLFCMCFYWCGTTLVCAVVIYLMIHFHHCVGNQTHCCENNTTEEKNPSQPPLLKPPPPFSAWLTVEVPHTVGHLPCSGLVQGESLLTEIHQWQAATGHESKGL